MREINEITGGIVDAAIKIHKEFGPGLLESVYEKLLTAELESRGFKVECQKVLPLTYAGRTFKDAYRIDMMVDDRVIVELKSTSAMAPVFPKQLRTYLVLSHLEAGLLLNFGMNTMKEGLVRVVNNYKPECGRAIVSGETFSTTTSISAPSAISAGENKT